MFAIPPEKFDNSCRILKKKFQFDDREKRPEINGKRVSLGWHTPKPDYVPKTEQTKIV